MKRVRIFLALSICFFLFGCSKEENKITEYEELTMEEAGEPYSDWCKSTTGSAKYLDGSSLLVTIYLDDIESHWTNSDEELVATNTHIACQYLKEQGIKYGKQVELIYDTSIYPDLVYRLSYEEAFSGAVHSLYQEDRDSALAYSIFQFIENKIDSKALMEKYNVNSIGYMVFADGESDQCVAYPYYTHYGEDYYTEFCVINLRWTGGENVGPNTYAHELLHLFGARDLYYTSKSSGIYKDFVIYADDNYQDDIMLGGYSDAIVNPHSIGDEITKLTAYFIGWMGYITEIEEFPTIKVKYQASFSEAPTGNIGYVDYSLADREYDFSNLEDDYLSRFVTVVIIVVIFLATMISFKIKNNRMKASIYTSYEDNASNYEYDEINDNENQ